MRELVCRSDLSDDCNHNEGGRQEALHGCGSYVVVAWLARSHHDLG